jgi:2-C-methyl-D-erythritol 4-phosphate cytidylyltransferase
MSSLSAAGSATDVLPEVPPTLGIVVEEGRGSLPFALVHGEALVACAAWALGEAGVLLVDATVAWEQVRDAGQPLVLQDALCPLTPPDFIVECVRRAVAADVSVAGVRPVTDTVKEVVDGVVGATVDREGLVSLAAPVVLPPRVVRTLDRAPGPDLAALVASLPDVELAEAPSAGRAVASAEDVRLLEALTDPRR